MEKHTILPDSATGRHFPPSEKNSRKKLIFTNLCLKPEIFFGVTPFSDIYIIKNDKILPISSI